ncbi:MAG: DNA topoisomerase I [Pseudomonadota bacterium]
MSKNLVIVESPAKGKTIEKYLGKDYTVLASYGHVRDLVPKEGAVDTNNDFGMRYQVIERNEKHVDKIARALKKADRLLLATDPDREGEAISWHLVELLQEKELLEGKDVQRVVFHEITKRAIQDAVDHPRELSNDLINAQQARRALDYLVGFNLSPLLWKKIRRGLSAGRVQSPALRMIAEREDEIEKFVPREYWSVNADLTKATHDFQAKLRLLDGEKVSQFTIDNGDAAAAAKASLEGAANGTLTVAEVTKKQRKRNPSPPFTTSTMQQESVRKLGFSAQRTMRTAQQLYEGIDTGSGQVGLITYMRTDSVTLAQDALTEIRALIADRYGPDNLPDAPNVYKNKSKNAQEAHEAVRPTSSMRTPDDLKAHLSDDQYRLYNLIWKRTVASQMIHATMDQVSIDFACGALDGEGQRNQFRATGSTIRTPGFISVYQEGSDDKKEDDDNRTLPSMEKGDTINLKEVLIAQHFTEPPPRYTEASLVKALEEYGIGRPSTYASIISTLQAREYVEIEQRRFTPTDVGRVVNRFLSKHFTQYVDYDFTAKLEDELDAVSRGEKEWVPLMRSFWDPFKDQVADKEENVSRDEAVQARELGTDPESGKPVSVRIGRYGPFVQIGTRDDEEKPKFAGLRPGQKMDLITLPEALKLFDLPRHFGEGKDKISIAIGRFGPYVKFHCSDEDKVKYASIKEDDPYTISEQRARELVAEKQETDRNRIIKVFPGTEIQLLNGRWGPYLTNGEKNAKLPKELKEDLEKLKAMDLATAEKFIAEAPEKKFGKKKAVAKKAESKKTTAKKTASKKKSSKKKASTRKKAAAKKTASKKTVDSKK